MTKLDRLARSLRDATDIAEELTRRQVRLDLGGSVYDPTDPVGRLLFNVLGMVAEFESGPNPSAHARGHGHGEGAGETQGAKAQALSRARAAHGGAPPRR